MTAPALNKAVQGEGTVSADNFNSFEQTCSIVAELREFIGTTGMQVFLRGLVADGDGGAGVFYWVEGGTGTDDGVNVIVPNGGTGLWLRLGTLVVPALTVSTGTSVDLTTAVGLIYIAISPSAPFTVNLPADPISNAPIVIIDALGHAGGDAITVNGNGHLINGAATNVINTAYGAAKYVYNADLIIPAWILTT